MASPIVICTAEEIAAALGAPLPWRTTGAVVLSAERLACPGRVDTPRARTWLRDICARLPWPAVSRLCGGPRFVSWSHLHPSLCRTAPTIAGRDVLSLRTLLSTPPPARDDRDLLLLSCQSLGGGCGNYEAHWAAPDLATLRAMATAAEPWPPERIAHAAACESWTLSAVQQGRIQRTEALDLDGGLRAALVGAWPAATERSIAPGEEVFVTGFEEHDEGAGQRLWYGENSG